MLWHSPSHDRSLGDKPGYFSDPVIIETNQTNFDMYKLSQLLETDYALCTTLISLPVTGKQKPAKTWSTTTTKKLNSDNPFASCKHEYLFELISFQIQSFGWAEFTETVTGSSWQRTFAAFILRALTNLKTSGDKSILNKNFSCPRGWLYFLLDTNSGATHVAPCITST